MTSIDVSKIYSQCLVLHQPRCGLLGVGDRILAVNGASTAGTGATEATQLITTSHPRVTLTVEFDISKHTASGLITVEVEVKESPLGVGVCLAGET